METVWEQLTHGKTKTVFYYIHAWLHNRLTRIYEKNFPNSLSEKYAQNQAHFVFSRKLKVWRGFSYMQGHFVLT